MAGNVRGDEATEAGEALIYLFLPAVGIGVGLGLLMFFMSWSMSKLWESFAVEDAPER